MTDAQANTLETTSDLGRTPEAEVRRWKLEIKLADKRESAWRKRATDIYKMYTPENPASNSFNILWTNTETLRQSVYNSLPQPDARRRYQDEDPLGKAVGDVLTRSLEFAQDTYDFDGILKADVLSMLLAGRAQSRVRYIPDIRETGKKESATEAQEPEAYEEIAWEQVICEHVQWDDFRILCAAKTWDEVSAIGFRHRFTRDDCIEKFGKENGALIPLDSADDEDVKNSLDDDLFKTAEVWEIWDKDEKKVHFICPTFAQPCKSQPDPLELQGFYPVPRPLYAIENNTTLIPAAFYTQYEQQAKELNKISMRINKLVDALKMRGVYDATMTELSEVMKAGDNQLIPSQGITALMERGGIEKGIWMMPIDTAAMVIKELYVQRDATKQVIYEITGISDIMRSASDPSETFGAQRIKTQWGTQRLQRMQKEVQRYIRDLIRLKAEVIAAKFQPETLESMTLLQIPHQAELDQAAAQAKAAYQQSVQQAQQAGQPPPPPPQQPPPQITWEQVVEAMRNDATRTYRIDIETDSTLSATQDSDMQGLQQVLEAVVKVGEGFAPAVQSGAMPIEAVKEIILAVVRRAKLGSAVEDALEKMSQPAPPPDPNAGPLQLEQQKAQTTMQVEQQKGQTTMQVEQMKAQIADQASQRELQFDKERAMMDAQISAQVETHKQEMQARQVQQQNELEAQRNQQQNQLEHERELQRMQVDANLESQKIELDRYRIDMEYRKAIEVAEIAAGATLQAAQISAAKQAASGAE